MADSDAASAGRIFISYRRDDTAYAAGWLFDRLADRFGHHQIFKDVDSIQLGDDFVDVIARAVASCDVLLALIGDQWLTLTDEEGRPRLAKPDDFVRIEIETALKRDVRIIPILVEGAPMPSADELPPSLARLARRQALELSPSRFEFDTGRLLDVLDAEVAEAHAVSNTERPPWADRPTSPQSTSGRPISTRLRGRWPYVAAVALAVLVGVGAAFWWNHSSARNESRLTSGSTSANSTSGPTSASPTSEPTSANAAAERTSINRNATIPAVYFGTWKGTVSQLFVDFPVVLTIHSGRGGTIVGSSLYPSSGCSGELTLLDAKSTSVVLFEQITSNSGLCTPNATITLRFNTDKSIAFQSATGNELELVNATLIRS
jgi:hypothetical protein